MNLLFHKYLTFLFKKTFVTNRGADDRASFVNLVKELRLAFEGEAVSNKLPRLLLTAAVPASPEAIAAG
jgi:chitinase